MSSVIPSHQRIAGSVSSGHCSLWICRSHGTLGFRAGWIAPGSDGFVANGSLFRMTPAEVNVVPWSTSPEGPLLALYPENKETDGIDLIEFTASRAVGLTAGL